MSFNFLISTQLKCSSDLQCLYTFTLTSSQFEKLSSTSTILATQLLKKKLTGKATVQSYYWLLTLLS